MSAAVKEKPTESDLVEGEFRGVFKVYIKLVVVKSIWTLNQRKLVADGF